MNINAYNITCEWIDNGHGQKTLWQHGQLFSVLASNIRYTVIQLMVLILFHAICADMAQ